MYKNCHTPALSVCDLYGAQHMRGLMGTFCQIHQICWALVGEGKKQDGFQSHYTRKNIQVGKCPLREPGNEPLPLFPCCFTPVFDRNHNGRDMFPTIGKEERGMPSHFPTKWSSAQVTFLGTIVMRVSDTFGSSQYKFIHPPTAHSPMFVFWCLPLYSIPGETWNFFFEGIMKKLVQVTS